MILAIDVGNSNIVLGGIDKDKIHFLSRIATDRQKTENEYAVIMRSIFQMNGVDPHDFDGAIISLVVPPLVQTLQNAVKSVIGKTPLLLEPGLKTGLNILIDNPAQLGADLVAGAVAAINKYPPWVVIDMATATTFPSIRTTVFWAASFTPACAFRTMRLSPAPRSFLIFRLRPRRILSAQTPWTACRAV